MSLDGVLAVRVRRDPFGPRGERSPFGARAEQHAVRRVDVGARLDSHAVSSFARAQTPCGAVPGRACVHVVVPGRGHPRGRNSPHAHVTSEARRTSPTTRFRARRRRRERVHCHHARTAAARPIERPERMRAWCPAIESARASSSAELWRTARFKSEGYSKTNCESARRRGSSR